MLAPKHPRTSPYKRANLSARENDQTRSQNRADWCQITRVTGYAQRERKSPKRAHLVFKFRVLRIKFLKCENWA